MGKLSVKLTPLSAIPDCQSLVRVTKFIHNIYSSMPDYLL